MELGSKQNRYAFKGAKQETSKLRGGCHGVPRKAWARLSAHRKRSAPGETAVGEATWRASPASCLCLGHFAAASPPAPSVSLVPSLWKVRQFVKGLNAEWPRDPASPLFSIEK